MSVFWFLVGAFLGFDVTLAYAWLSERRANRSVVQRVGLYVGDDIHRQLRHWDEVRRRNEKRQALLRGVRKPW